MAEHDPFTVEDTKAKQKLVRSRFEERNRGDVSRVVSTVEGRRFLWRVLCEAKVYNTCFDANALVMSSNEGRRDIGLFVMNEILKASPEAIEKMRSEAESDRLVREAELAKTEKGDNKNG